MKCYGCKNSDSCDKKYRKNCKYYEPNDKATCGSCKFWDVQKHTCSMSMKDGELDHFEKGCKKFEYYQ